jgi:excisionase family DNA binding protein
MDTITQAPPTEATIRLKEAATRLGLHPVTLKRRANAGDLPAYRDGAGRWLFADADLDRFRAAFLTPQPYVPPATTVAD